jgi:hypothetical protein
VSIVRRNDELMRRNDELKFRHGPTRYCVAPALGVYIGSGYRVLDSARFVNYKIY